MSLNGGGESNALVERVNGNRKPRIFGNRKLHTFGKGVGTGLTHFGWYRSGVRGWKEGS